ncbi:MAG: hypothetical protein NC388_08055 [Clostridium sp.]|nr:hypothetical protein [Clostridium sp.]
MKKIINIVWALLLCAPVMAQTEDTVVVDSTEQVGAEELTQTETNELKQELEKMRAERSEVENSVRMEKIWRKSRPFTISIGNQTLTDEEAGVKYKSNIAVSISKMRTYYLHKKPIANMVKLGIDAVWMDMSYARYAKGKGVKDAFSGTMGTVTEGTFNNMDDYFDLAYGSAMDYENDEFSLNMERINLGKHSFTYNMGVGLNVKVAPFYALNKPKLDNLKASVYFHWLPGFTGLIFTGDETEFSYGALMRHYSIGLNISYGRWGIGVEHRWGSADLKNWQMDDEEDDYYAGEGDSDFISTTSDKLKYKLSGTRFYIGFRF